MVSAISNGNRGGGSGIGILLVLSVEAPG